MLLDIGQLLYTVLYSVHWERILCFLGPVIQNTSHNLYIISTFLCVFGWKKGFKFKSGTNSDQDIDPGFFPDPVRGFLFCTGLETVKSQKK